MEKPKKAVKKTVSKVKQAVSKGKEKIVRFSNRGKSKAEILEKNRRRGAAFENKKFAQFQKKYAEAQKQITVRTPSGKRTRLDAIGLEKNGNVVIHEFKSSWTAPLRKNQEVAFAEILKHGATVVGRGKGIFTGGYSIDIGTAVKVIRPLF